MKHQSFRSHILKFTTFLLCFVLSLQIILFIFFHILFQDVRNTVNHQNLYITYEEKAALLQDSVTDYFDSPSQDSLDSLNENILIFSDLSDQISGFFQSAQFSDTAALTEAYLTKIRELTVSITDTSNEHSFSLYKECSHLYDLMLKQHSTTLPFEMKALSDQLDLVFTNWNLSCLLFLLFLLVLFLFILFATFQNIRKLVKPLSLLTEHAQAFEKGNFKNDLDSLLQENNYYEIFILTSAFLHMENTIHEQICALEDKIELSKKLHALELEHMSSQALLAQTENSLMQSLINPHFLFNCLNLLSSLAIMEKAPKVHKYALQIARYLRESLDYNGKTITLDREFLFIQHYADIQQVRFGDRIQFEFFCDDDCKNAQIPAIILQPLIENSLVHGVGSYLQNGHIRICAEKKGTDQVCITIWDNGSGIPQKQLEELICTLHTPFQVGQKGTGLRSVFYRLNYYFQQSCSEILHNNKNIDFIIESDAVHTSIIITIPYVPALSETS